MNQFKRYIVEADVGYYEQREFVFTTDDKKELDEYLLNLDNRLAGETVMVFDCDKRAYIEDELVIKFQPSEPRADTQESALMAELWRLETEKIYNTPKLFNKKTNDK